MNLEKEKIREWVKALRSGEYEQGHEELFNNDDSFCCLGVLAITQLDTKEEREYFKTTCYIEGCGYLHDLDTVVKRSTIAVDVHNKVGGIYLDEKFQEILAGLNDGTRLENLEEFLNKYFPNSKEEILNLSEDKRVRLNFNQIADFLEKDYLT